ncbi:MAG: 23S rRNA (adenine(2503)-C(2))-methyltransferase RlmN [Planctomycetaceae bacterium]
MTTTPPKPAIAGLKHHDLLGWLESCQQPQYRAAQIERWLYRNRAASFADMLDLPAELRQHLQDRFSLFSTTLTAHRTARDRTEKLLLALDDQQLVECVLMRETRRQTVCISTQVGCGMGCVFCASGLDGLKRNLSRAEILEQVLRLDRLLKPDKRITNVVVMGIGEPLANLEVLLDVLDTLCDPAGLGLGARRITISTVGLPDRMRDLARHGRPFNLAVSLHAPNDELRNTIVPVNSRTGIAAILAAADEYFERTGRRVTYEYVLLGGINDAPAHAHELASLLAHRNAHLNLIPMNPVSELEFREPAAPRTDAFAHILNQAGVVTTVRKRKGEDIDAACGQLRLKQQREQPSSQDPAPSTSN